MMSNNSLSNPRFGGIGRGNLSKAIRSYFSVDENVYQDYKQPMTQGAQQLFDKAALSAQKDENGSGMAERTGNGVGNGDGDGDGQWQITTHICDSVKYTYLTPSSLDTALDFLAKDIKSKDFNDTRIAVVCEHAMEAAQLMRQLGKRSVACLLFNEPNEMIVTCVRLWTEGWLNSVLVVSDNMLLLLAEYGNMGVNYLIHSTQPLPHVFQKRIQALIPTPGKDTQVLVMRYPAATQLEHVTAASAVPAATPLNGQAKRLATAQISLKALTAIVNGTSSVASKLKGTDAISETMPGITAASKVPLESAGEKTTKLSKFNWQLPMERQFDSASGAVYTYNIYNIFAWSRSKQVSCFNIRDVAGIAPNIKAAMEQLDIGYMRAKSVQRFAWPHVAAGRSLCVIGNELVGKTWCYLPSLCQRVSEDILQRDASACDFGPSCIILCANATQGDHIGSWCMELLGKPCVEMDLMIKLFSRGNIAEVASRLRRPCGILLTNAEQLLHLFKYNDKTAPIFNPLAVRCVAFDNFDASWRTCRMDCEEMMQWLLDFVRFQKGHAQLFIVGRLWSDVLMARVLPHLPDVLLLFQDALEASVFFGHKLKLLTTSAQQHKQDIIELLQAKNLNEERVVLACLDKADADKLSQRLSAKNISNIVIDPKAYGEWSKEHTGHVLIIFDDVVPRFRGENIDCLLHYNYTNTWARFKARFSLFYGNGQASAVHKKGTSIIHICAADIELNWLICDFMFKHDHIPPNSYLSLMTDYRNNGEIKKPRYDVSLCRQLLSYGNCYRHTCQYRHMLWDYEPGPPDHHPRKGEIKFNLISSPTPAHLAVRLTEFKVSSYFIGSPVTKLGMNIQLHYEDPLNHRRHSNPTSGDLCVAKLNKQYQRVGVIRVLGGDRIEIKQLDLGTDFLIIHASDLLECDDRFKDETFEANDLRITGLTPLNMERIWPDDAKRLVRQKFFNRLQGNRVFTANVDFAFHEMIFVTNVFDEEGNDLKSFVLEHIQAYMDKDVKSRLKKAVALAKPFLNDINVADDDEIKQHLVELSTA